MALRTITLSVLAAMTLITSVDAGAQRGRASTHSGNARKTKPVFVHRAEEGEPGRGKKKARRPTEPAVIEVFKDFDAWSGENRDGATLAALGKVSGVDWFVHTVSELADGISPNADVVLITSNSFGDPNTRDAQNDPAAQANLAAFVAGGGVLIVDMGDNLSDGGFRVPGAVGTPDLVFPEDAADATLTAAAAGPDRVLGTADDHRLARGPDGVPGTADDLTNTNIDACCSVAHGNLQDGIALPPTAVVLMTAGFGDTQKPIVAEYCLGSGRVIVDTVTKEYWGHQPEGQGPSYFLSALLAYAMDPKEPISCQINGLRESVRWMAGDAPHAAGLDAKLRGAAAAIDRGRVSAACGKIGAFVNAVRAHARDLPAPVVGEWLRVAARIQSALGC
jgi:hypothetical protein